MKVKASNIYTAFQSHVLVDYKEANVIHLVEKSGRLCRGQVVTPIADKWQEDFFRAHGMETTAILFVLPTAFNLDLSILQHSETIQGWR